MPVASQVVMQCLPNTWPQVKRTGGSELTLMAMNPTVVAPYVSVQMWHARSSEGSSSVSTTGRPATKDSRLSGGFGRTWVSDAIG